VEKARSLVEAEATLDEADDGYAVAGPEEGNVAASAGPLHASGFAPASASQSGFSPAGTPRGEPSGLHSRLGGVESVPPSAELAGASGNVSGGNISRGNVSGGRLVDSLQGALSAASRNEAGLGSLQRAIRDASRAFTASRQAQEALTEELRVMHRGLNELMSEKAAVERYSALLIQERDAALDAAEDARREAQREREFLLREQDRFIQLLLEEHEAELSQLRRSLVSRSDSDAPPTGEPQTRPAVALAGRETSTRAGADALERPFEGRKSSPPGEGLSGAALARQALANTAVNDPHRPVPVDEGELVPGGEGRSGERLSSYPPPPAVLDLDVLAAEVDGNSERPPPIRRIGMAEPAKIHLKPARVPQLFDTLVSPVDESDPKRKG
jgi:hypothetical protein